MASRTSLRRTAEIPGIGNRVRWVFVGHGLEVRRLLGPGPQALFPADEVDPAMVHHRQEEGPERTAILVEGLRCPPQGQEGVVDDILGEDLLPGHPIGQAVGL